MLKAICVTLRGMRPAQWTKNVVLLAPLVFSQNLLNEEVALQAFVGFLVFCIVSSAVYLFNDVVDKQRDRQHPYKSKRPVASGQLPVAYALGVSALLGGLGIGAVFLFHVAFAWLAVAYGLVQIAYCLVFKHIVILDIVCIAANFMLRVFAGATVIGVAVSSWLLICTFFISLMIALTKRRHEVVLLEGQAKAHRQVLEHYTVSLLDPLIAIVTAATVISYSLYTLSSETVARFGTDHLKYTIPFVLYGIYRYLYLVYRCQRGGSPEDVLLTDLPMIVTIVLYCVVVGFVLY